MTGLTKERLKLAAPAYQKSKKGLVGDYFRIIVHKNPGTRIELALELHRRQKASLAKCAELAGVTTIEFKEILAERGIKREVEGDRIAEIDEKIEEVF
jgi:predicted HTH domain antitoxin